MTFQLEPPPAPKTPRIRRGGWSWGPVEGAKLRVMSNGGGIQSTTLIMMMCTGDLPWVDHIIHAETGDDGDFTARHLDWLDGQVTRYSNGRVGLHRVTRGGRLSDRIRNRAAGKGVFNNDRFVSAPFYTSGGKGGRGGQGKRQCTREFKIEPLEKKQRELLGYKPRQRIPAGYTPGMREQEFLHRARVPLDQVDLSTAEERGQGMLMVCDAGCGL